MKLILVESILAALSASFLLADAQQVVSLIHINDHHSHFDEAALTLSADFIPPGLSVETSEIRMYHGGAPRVAAQIDAFRQEAIDSGNDVCVVHAGDALTGTSYYSFYGPSMDAAFMNTVGFDVMVVGNHEFDDGDENLANFTRMLDASMISYNLQPHSDSAILMLADDDNIAPYFIKELADGTQLGFCGITTKVATELSSRPDEGTTLMEEVEAIVACVAELEAMGINKIVAITHWGYEEDATKMTAIDGVDVVIGGHAHTLLGDEDVLGMVGLQPTAPYAQIINGTCVAQAWDYNKIVGKLDIVFDENGDVEVCEGTLAIPLNPDVFTVRDADPRFDLNETDAAIAAEYLLGLGLFTDPGEDMSVVDVLQPFRDDADSFLEISVATVAENICHTRAGGAYDPNCPDTPELEAVGGGVCLIVAQSFLFNVPNADIGLNNAGGCRTSMLAGNFTYGDAYTVLPFSNTLVILTMTGDQIRRVLEDAVNFFLDESLGGGSGSFPNAAGLRWKVNYTMPFGERFYDLEVNPRLEGDWEPLDMEDMYTMVTNDFIATPLDGYFTFGEIPKDDPDLYVNTYVLYTQSLIDYTSFLGIVTEPPREEYSTQVLTLSNGTTIDIRLAEEEPDEEEPGEEEPDEEEPDEEEPDEQEPDELVEDDSDPQEDSNGTETSVERADGTESDAKDETSNSVSSASAILPWSGLVAVVYGSVALLL